MVVLLAVIAESNFFLVEYLKCFKCVLVNVEGVGGLFELFYYALNILVIADALGVLQDVVYWIIVDGRGYDWVR